MTSPICMTGRRGRAGKSHAAGGCRRLRAWRCSIGLWSVRRGDGRWQLAGGTGMGLINGNLGYLADRGHSPQTVRAYASGLQAFARWLAAKRLALGEVSADVVLRYLAYPSLPAGAAAGTRGRQRVLHPGRPQRRLCACDDQPAAGRCVGPVRLRGDAGPGCARPKRRSGLRVREPRRLPRGLDRAETTALRASFRTDQKRCARPLTCLPMRTPGRPYLSIRFLCLLARITGIIFPVNHRIAIVDDVKLISASPGERAAWCKSDSTSRSNTIGSHRIAILGSVNVNRYLFRNRR
jgi:hypothetical protein